MSKALTPNEISIQHYYACLDLSFEFGEFHSERELLDFFNMVDGCYFE